MRAHQPCLRRSEPWADPACQASSQIRQRFAIVNGSSGRESCTMAYFWLFTWGNRSRWRIFGLTMAIFWRLGPGGWHGRRRGAAMSRRAPDSYIYVNGRGRSAACNTLAFSTRYSTRSSYPQLFGVNESMATGTTLANGGCAGGRADGRASHAGSRAPFQHSAENRSSKHGARSTRLHLAPIQKAGWQRIQNYRDTSVFHARIKPKVARNTDLSRHFRILRQRRKPDGRESSTVATLLGCAPAPKARWQKEQNCRNRCAEDLWLIIAVGMQVACR